MLLSIIYIHNTYYIRYNYIIIIFIIVSVYTDISESQGQPTQPIEDQKSETETRRHAFDADSGNMLLSRLQWIRGRGDPGADERSRGNVPKEQSTYKNMILAYSVLFKFFRFAYYLWVVT